MNMPIIGRYRGVGIHDFQDQSRVEGVVRPAIDAVHAMNDAEALYDYAISYKNPPEARQFAAAKVQAIAEAHQLSRGDIDLAALKRSVIGLGNIHWTESTHYFAMGTPGALAPCVRSTLEARPPHHVERLKAARELARRLGTAPG